MVADAATVLKKGRKLKPWYIPESTRLSVRSLYVIHGRQPSDIAKSLDLTPGQVSNLVKREGWKRLKDQNRAKRLQIATESQDARAPEDIARVVETTAILSEELSIRSLNLSSELLDAKDAKGLQMASGSALNFVKIARMSRGLDAKGSERSSSDVNLYIVRGETIERSEKNVTASAAPIAIQATPA